MIITPRREGVQDVLIVNLFRIVMDQETSRRRVEFGGADTMTHLHEGLANLIVDCAVFEQGIFYPQPSWHTMNIAIHATTSFCKGIF